MAHVGGGCEEFFEVQKKSHWERKIRSQLSKAFQPALTGVSVDWLQHDDNAPTPIQVQYNTQSVVELHMYVQSSILSKAPKEIVSLFSGSRLVVYGFVPHCKQVHVYIHIVCVLYNHSVLLYSVTGNIEGLYRT